MIDFVLPLRALQFFAAIISLGLNGYVAHYFNQTGNASYYYQYESPSQVNFMIFVSLWTMLVLVYLSLAPTVLQKFANKFVIAGLDALAMLFWFAGFIALAVFHHDIGYCYGRVCHTMVAAIVFGAFEWLLFVATTIVAALHIVNNRGGSSKPAAHEGGRIATA